MRYIVFTQTSDTPQVYRPFDFAPPPTLLSEKEGIPSGDKRNNKEYPLLDIVILAYGLCR